MPRLRAFPAKERETVQGFGFGAFFSQNKLHPLAV